MTGGPPEVIFEAGEDGSSLTNPRANPAHDVCFFRYYDAPEGEEA